MPEWMALLPSDPEAVGPYRLEGRLGVGGQGTVYVGSAVSGRRVAIKLLHPHLAIDKTARSRFLSEVEIAKRVALFCTAKVLDSGFVNEQPYIVSEFVDGPSLQESVRDTGPRSGAALERLALNTATALAAIHQAGVVHRDFKPGNVLLGPDGPVVIDFGIARALDISRSIITSQAVGSPGYMAPEQIADDEIGPAVDLFAWGATMVFAATGERAFSGESIPAVIRSILHDQPDLDGLDRRLGAIVRACLAKDPARRPTAAEVVNGLCGMPGPAWRTGDPSVSGPDDKADQEGREEPAPTGNAGRRRSVLVGAAALVPALVTILGIAYFVVPSDRGGENFNASRAPLSSLSSSSGPPSSGIPVSPSPADDTVGQTESPSAHPRKTPKADTQKVPEADTTRQSPRRPEDAPKPKSTRSAASEKPPSPPYTEKPSSPPSTKKPSSSPDTEERPPPSDREEQQRSGGEKQLPWYPKTLGSVSESDMNGYCQNQGYVGSGGGPGNYWCYGPGGMQVNMSSVCQWAYPGYPNAWAEGTACKSS
ncbi:serine/threonine protein kinase [Streptosporangium sp. NPDC000396]|uniref:serine/threonine protein kinase n=1 Tax=Streptosporangium sp. NPDC000396 TaxID=3366185 RepID=UPI0036A4CB3D